MILIMENNVRLLEWKVDERKKCEIGKFEGDFPFRSDGSDEIWAWWLPEIGLLIGGWHDIPNWGSEEAVLNCKVCLMLNDSREPESTIWQLAQLICGRLRWAKGGAGFQNICSLSELSEVTLTQNLQLSNSAFMQESFSIIKLPEVVQESKALTWTSVKVRNRMLMLKLRIESLEILSLFDNALRGNNCE